MQNNIKPKRTNRFLKLLFWLALSLAVFLAMFVLIAKLFMQNLPYWDKDILDYLQSKLNFELGYKNLSGEMAQIDAILSLEDLSLGAKKNPFLHIDKITVKTDFVKSLFNFALVFDRLEIKNLNLWLEEDDSGWYFRGLKKPKPTTVSSKQTPQLDTFLAALSYLELIFMQGSLKVENLNLYIKPKDYKEALLFSSNLEYADIFGGKQMYSQVESATKEKIGSLLVTKYNRFIGSYEGYEIFLDIPKLNVSDLAQHFSFLQDFKNYNLDKLNIFANLVENRITFEARSINLRASPSQKFSVTSEKIALSGEVFEDVLNLSYSIDGTKLIDTNKLEINIANLAGKVKDDLFETKINFTPIDLVVFKDKWHHKFFEAIPELNILQPTGIISSLEISLKEAEDLQVKVKLENSDIQAWSGAPSLKNLTAWVVATPSFGRVIFRQNNLQMGFPELFNRNFDIDIAQGLVDWELNSESYNGIAKNSLIVSGRNLLLEKEGAKISGAFNLFMPSDDLEAIYFDLNLALTEVPYYFVDEFLPEKIMSEELANWIKTSTKSGVVTNATLWIADSYVNKGKQKVDLSFEVKDATLKFLPEWQEIENLSGILNVNNGVVSASINSGTILGANLEKGEVKTYTKKGNNIWLAVNAKAQSKASIMQVLFKQTPIKNIIPQEISKWRAGGIVRADLDLKIPLTNKKDKPYIGFFVRLLNSKLNLVKPNLVFENIDGTFEFASNKGFFSKGLKAKLWGMPISAIGTDTNIFAIEGFIEPRRVFNWLSFDTKQIIRGASKVKGSFNLDTTQLKLVSNLNGIELNLPKPFFKEKSYEDSFLFDLNLKKSLLKIDYSDKLKLGIKLDAEPKYGIVNVADKNVEKIIIPPQGLFLSFISANLVLEDWLSWWSQINYKTAELFSYAKPLQKADSNFNWQVKLDTENLVFNNKNYQNLTAIARNSPALEVAFINPFVAGNFILNKNSSIKKLGSLHLEKLHLPEDLDFSIYDKNKSKSKNSNFNSNKLKGSGSKTNKKWSLAKFKPLSLKIDSLKLGMSNYGSLSANIKTDNRGLEIEQINWQLEDTNVDAYFNWRVIPYNRSKIEAKINGGNLSKTISAITNSKAPIITGEHSGLLRLAWIGSPFDIKLKNLNGNLDFNLQKGEFPKIDLGIFKGITRIFSLFNIDTLIRRLSLDFSDVTSSGLAFNSVEGSAVISEGVISTVSPIEVKSTATSFSLEGEVDLINNFINQELVVVLPVSQTLPLVALLAGASQVGIAIWAAQKLFGNFLDDFTKARYKVYGDLNNPDITLMKVF